jgi:type III secretion protein W
MVDRIGQSSGPQQIDPGLAASRAAAKGRLRGEEVNEERSIDSLVEDSFEEATFSIAEQSESVDVEEVAVEDLSTMLADRIKKQDRLRGDLDGVRSGLDPAKVRRMLAALLERGATAVDQVLREQFGDPTDQYAALDAALQELGRQRGQKDLRKALKEASDTLWEQHQEEIVAGLHATPVAQRFAHGDLEQFQALREAYRAQVLEQPTMLQSLKNLRERFGDDHLESQIRFLIAAAGRDLDALVSSVEKTRLEQTLGDLSRLQLISSMRAQADTIVTRMSRRFGVHGQRDWDLLQGAFELMEDQWVGAPKIETMTGTLALRQVEGEIYFLRELNAFFRNIPIKAYADPEGRDRLLQASQEALDHLIEREEEEEEAK